MLGTYSERAIGEATDLVEIGLPLRRIGLIGNEREDLLDGPLDLTVVSMSITLTHAPDHVLKAGQPGLEPGIAGFGDRCLSQLGHCPKASPNRNRGCLGLEERLASKHRNDAGGGTRTPTLLRAPGPKPGVVYQFHHARGKADSRGDCASCRFRGFMLAAGMEATTVREGYELWRPNREKAQSKTTKAIVAFVLLVSAGC